MLDEKGGRDHAQPIGHEARPPELAHAGVNDRIAGLPARPGAEADLIIPPGKARKLVAQRMRREIGMGEKQRGCEVAPAELCKIFLRASVARGVAGRRHDIGDAAGEISPKRKCADKRDVASDASKSRSTA